MANRSWTQDQGKALEFIGKNMLVSASAGSGKTTVMVEKIFRYLKTGSITRLIVITFTKASAADMKEKLTEQLAGAVRSGDENAEHYKEQLRALPLAYIGTIDSICQEIYKRWFEDIGGSPDFTVLEESEADALRADAIKSIADELIASEDADFKGLEERYTRKRGLQPLYDVAEKIMKFVDTQENPEEFYRRAIAEAKIPVSESSALKWLAGYYRKMLSAYLSRATVFVEKATESNIKKLLPEAYKVDDYVSALVHSDDETLFERVAETFSAKKPTATKKDEPKVIEIYGEFGAFLDDFRKLLKSMRESAGDFSLTMEHDAESRCTALKVIEFTKACSERYQKLKKEDSKVDFADLERNALAIVKIKERAQELREGTDYIFLDEYQDTNKLQEAIISRIERGNLFMVGDVKQAIYGFRSADADIFLRRYKSYKDESEGKNVPLNSNFRSEQRVLSFIDNVFSVVMTYDFGGIDYRKDSAFGKAGVPFLVTDNAPAVEVDVFTAEAKETDQSLPSVYSVATGKTLGRKVNPECNHVAAKIKEIVGTRSYFDNKRNMEKKVAYSDIAILVRDRTGAEELMRALATYGVPYDGRDMNTSGETMDIDAMDSLLRVIDNSEQDYALTATMLSYFGGFDERELAEIRFATPKEEFFYKSVRAYQGELKPKIDKFYDLVGHYARLAPLYDVPTLFSMIAGDTGFISYLFAGGEYDRIATFNSYVKLISGKTYAQNLGDYLAYKDSEPSLAIPKVTAAQDRVKILTMHKSKGLEFPVVFLVGCSRKMRGADTKGKVGTDSELGIAVEYFDSADNSSGKSLTRISFDKRAEVKSKIEEARIMYVAMTRAKHFLYISGFEGERGLRNITSPSEAQSFIDWIRYASKKNPAVDKFIKYNPEVPNPSLDEDREEPSAEQAVLGKISFLEYDHKEATALGTKYSVTALNTAEEREQSQFVQSLGTQDVDIGVAYHKVMELIDFNLCDAGEVALFVRGLEDDGVIERGKVDASVVANALRSPVFDVARKANKCRREQEFIYNAPACEVLDGAKTSDTTLVQGVIDLVIEGEKTIIVDYKVSGAPSAVLRERYRKQVELYASAYRAMTGINPSVKAVLVLNRGEFIEF